MFYVMVMQVSYTAFVRFICSVLLKSSQSPGIFCPNSIYDCSVSQQDFQSHGARKMSLVEVGSGSELGIRGILNIPLFLVCT